MLKHTSIRSESRNSYMSDDFMVTLTALNFSKDGDSIHDRSTDYLTTDIAEPYKTSVDRSSSFSSLLPTSTLRRIIERRKSDIMLQDHREKRKPGSIHESNAKEILQEIEKDNSRLVVHRRKVDNTDDSMINGLSDEQITDDKETTVDNKWRENIFPSPPLANSSPTSSPIKRSYSQNLCSQPKQENILRNDIIKKHGSKEQFCLEDMKLKGVEDLSISNRRKHPSRTQSLSRSIHSTRSDMPKRYRHPLSISTDMLDLKMNKIPNGSYSVRRPSSSKSADYWVSNRNLSKDTMSVRSQYCRSREKLDTLSVSAGSSVSNVKPPPRAMSRCSCGTIPRHNLLEKITEEMEIEHHNFNKKYDKKKNAVRYIKYFTIFLAVFAFICCAIAGFLHFYIRFIANELTLNQGDVKIVSISSLFCGGIEAISEDSGVRVITFQDSHNRKTLEYSRSEDLFLKPNVIWKREFYILKDSELTIEVETGESIDVLAFVGERNFSIWEQRHESETYLQKMKCCRDQSDQKNSFTITTGRNDRYFFAIKSLELLPINVEIKLKFFRKTFDFSKSVSSCSVKKQEFCSADYEFDTDNEIAIEVPLLKASNIPVSSRIEWKCEPRVWFYFVLFLGAFYLILLLLLANYFLITRYLIPRDKCFCLRESKKSLASENIHFYDNYGKTNSDIGIAESSYKHSIKRQQKPIYSDDVSRISDTSRFLGNLFETPSSVGTGRSIISKSAKQRPNFTVINHDFPEHAIAAIYNENMLEQADSGISVDPEVGPTAQSHLDAHELMHQQELQFQRLKYLRQQKRQAEFVEAPSVKNLLRRPVSREESMNIDFDKSLNNSQNYLHLSTGRYPPTYRSHSTVSEKIKPAHHVSFDSIDTEEYNKGEVYL